MCVCSSAGKDGCGIAPRSRQGQTLPTRGILNRYVSPPVGKNPHAEESAGERRLRRPCSEKRKFGGTRTRRTAQGSADSEDPVEGERRRRRTCMGGTCVRPKADSR